MAEPTYEELKAQLEQMKSEKEKRGNISLKVSEKGAVSVYGLGRFPVTLYQEQWQKLATAMPEVLQFIEANKLKLKVKE